MNDITKIQEQHTAGPQVIGFDYQFYYFISLALGLRHGQKIGFEVKDDIHIDRIDGTTVLYQTKHTISKKADGSADNLTTLDLDLWKTLSNWADMIKSDSTGLLNHSFCLVTNKSDDNNKFIDSLTLFRNNNDVNGIITILKELRDKTTDKELKSYIKNVISIGKNKSKLFYSKLEVATNTDDILAEIRGKIYECVRNTDLIEPVFDSLVSNLNTAKYIDIKERKKFEITFDEFNKRFGKCFKVAFKDKPLPKRQYPVSLPENLDQQTFIKQLIDIGELENNSNEIVNYTSQMLQAINNLSYWMENNFILPTEMDEFNKEAIIKWENEFRAKYRQIGAKIKAGTQIESLEADVKNLSAELLDHIRRQDLNIAGDTLGIELSNGHYYSLSDKPEIGWHFDWEKKYKTK